jgi:hypothetical protein
MIFPKHLSLTLTHNPHLVCYETSKQYLQEYSHIAICFEDHYARMIKTNEIWELYWHPNTPVLSTTIAAPTLEELLEICNNLKDYDEWNGKRF